jgi:hypothetical protein
MHPAVRTEHIEHIRKVSSWLNEGGLAPSWVDTEQSHAYKFGVAAAALARAVRVINDFEAER